MNHRDLSPPDQGRCPYCGTALVEYEPNAYEAWPNNLSYCPSNDCSYFRSGRREIADRFQKNFGYRYCWDPVTQQAFPRIAWCPGGLSYLKGRCAG